MTFAQRLGIYLLSLILLIGVFVYFVKNTPEEGTITPVAALTIIQEEPTEVLSAETTTKGEFVLEIPEISLKKDIVKNVDPRDKDIYGPVIARNIAHGKFTRLPDEATDSGNVYLFAHRDGNSEFGNMGFFKRLDELSKGDKAFIRYNGQLYTYTFTSSKIVDPSDTAVYTGYSPTPTLTLQTCNNGETERLIVKFELESVL